MLSSSRVLLLSKRTFFFKFVDRDYFADGIWFDYSYNHRCNKKITFTNIDGLRFYEDYGENIMCLTVPPEEEKSLQQISETRFSSETINAEEIYSYKKFLKDDTILPDVKIQMKIKDLRVGIFQTDRSTCLAAVKNDGNILQYIKDQFIDEEVCLAAVEQTGYAIESVPLQHMTKKVCLAAIENYYGALDKIPLEKIDKEMCLKAVRTHEHTVQSVPRFLVDEEICLAAIEKDPLSVKFLKYSSFFDETVALDAISRNYLAAMLCEHLFDDNKEMCLAAVKANASVIKILQVKYMDEEICLAAVQKDGNVIKYIPSQYKNQKLFLEAVKSKGNSIQYIPFKDLTKEICLAAVENDGMNLEYIPDKLVDEDVFSVAVRNNRKAVKYTNRNILGPC